MLRFVVIRFVSASTIIVQEISLRFYCSFVLFLSSVTFFVFVIFLSCGKILTTEPVSTIDFYSVHFPCNHQMSFLFGYVFYFGHYGHWSLICRCHLLRILRDPYFFPNFMSSSLCKSIYCGNFFLQFWNFAPGWAIVIWIPVFCVTLSALPLF